MQEKNKKDSIVIGTLAEGFVLDHIQAGMAMTVYQLLDLGALDCTVAIIKNASSVKMGRKDIIKVAYPIEKLPENFLSVLGFIDNRITLDIIRENKIVEKKKLSLPTEVRNVIRCKNPRCITSVEHSLDQSFILTEPETRVYRCRYCEQKWDGHLED